MTIPFLRVLGLIVCLTSSTMLLGQCPGYSTQEVIVYRRNSPIRTGTVSVEGDYKGTYHIRLYHSDTPGEIFATWHCRENTTITLAQENTAITIASDWGIQIEFENGVTSCVYFLGDIARYQDGTFYVKSTSIYTGR